MKMVDCQGLAGTGTTLGGVRSGFELVHRVALPGGFGNPLVEENADLLGGDFDIETGPLEEWTPMKGVALVSGTPPCSGFSLMNTSAAVAKNKGQDAPASARGPGSAINMCQRQLVEYAALCTGTDGKKGSEFAVFESVQGAFGQGLDLMREYWQIMRHRTGLDYELSHVKMSVASIGGAQLRHRYFWVAHRVPFGIEFELPKRVTTVEDAIGDLYDQPLDWEAQDYVAPAKSQYARELRGGGVTNHLSNENRPIQALAELLPYWEKGKNINTATKRFIEAQGFAALPEHLAKKWQPELGMYKGFMWPWRQGDDEPSAVLTGGCAQGPIHPFQDRFFTTRELARLMAIPDDWTFDSAKSVMQSGMWIGKACTVGAAQWLSDRIMASLDGRAEAHDDQYWHEDAYKKIELAPGERVYDITSEYKKFENHYKHVR